MALKVQRVELTPIAASGCRIENLVPDQPGDEAVFHCETYDSEVICGYFVPFTDYLAESTYLPVASSGLVVCKGEVLIGKRSAKMCEYPLHFELIPSGGIDRTADSTEELLLQCVGDTGIDSSCLSEMMPIALIEDRVQRSLDICMVIELRDRPELHMQRAGYTGARWVSIEEFRLLIEAAPVVPTSVALFEYWQKSQ